MAVQTGFSINPPPAKPGKVILALDVTSMEKEQIDALTGEVKAYGSGLKDNGFDIGGKKNCCLSLVGGVEMFHGSSGFSCRLMVCARLCR